MMWDENNTSASVLGFQNIVFPARLYDKQYVMQCNQEQIENEIKELNQAKEHYIDSLYQKVIYTNEIDIMTYFIHEFPKSKYVDDIKSRRKKLFKIKEKVEISQYNIDYLIKKNPCYIPIYKNIDYIRNKNILLKIFITQN